MARGDLDPEAVDPADRLAAMGGRPSAGWVPDQGMPVVEVRQADPPPQRPGERPPNGGVAREWLLDRAPLWAHDYLERLTIGSVITATLILVAVAVVAGVLFHRHSASRYPSYSTSSNVPPAGAYPTAVPTGFDPGPGATSIVVDVGGRVRHPGLVTLPAGARVADALEAAGGPIRHREIATLDLAAHVTDGQLLLIGGTESPPGATMPTSPSSAAPVSLNSATLEQLDTLPGVGPVTAQKILDWRTAHSGFTSVEQLQQVSGIGPATYAELSPLVTP
jgi:competence protein ComEA